MHMMVMYRIDHDLLMNGLWKTKFRENLGRILDFPGVPDENKY